MIIIITVFSSALCAFTFLGLYVLFLNVKEKLNRIFFITALCTAFMCLGGILMQASPDEETVLVIYKAGTMVSILIILSHIYFAVNLTNLFKRNWLVCLPFLLSGFYFFIAIPLTYPFISFIRYQQTWRMNSIQCPHIFYPYCAFFTLCVVFYSVCLLVWKKRTTSIRQKRQVAILIFSLLLNILTYIFYMLVFFHILHIPTYQVPGDGVASFLIWGIGNFIAIVRYRFLSLTTELTSHEIVNNIDEAIFMLNSEYMIIKTNKKAEELLNLSSQIIKHKNIFDFIVEKNILVPRLQQLMRKKTGSLSENINLRFDSQGTLLVKARFSLVLDKFEDLLGILVIAREVRGMEKLKTIYGISTRELEVIKHVLTGSSNRQISLALHITERTVKAHITNIYNKMGINNKLQLFQIVTDS